MTTRSYLSALAIAVALGIGVAPEAFSAQGSPSRKPQKGCVWEQRTDADIGLQSWVQRCDFGFRKIDFLVVGHSLAQRYSDGGTPEPVIDVFDLAAGESLDAGMKRVFTAATEKTISVRCVLAPFRADGMKTPVGVKRYTFVPDAAYGKELAKTQDPGDIPEPPCGAYGAGADSIAYFETQPAAGSRHFVYVHAGQDTPLFDETTLKLLPPSVPALP